MSAGSGSRPRESTAPRGGLAASPVSDEYQTTHGLYMLGQVAALRRQTTTIAELHRRALCRE